MRARLLVLVCCSLVLVAGPVRAASAAWKPVVVGRDGGHFTQAKAAFSPSGRLYVAGQYGVLANVALLFPRERVLGANNELGASIGITFRGETPLISWAKRKLIAQQDPNCPGCIGVDRPFDTVQLAAGPTFDAVDAIKIGPEDRGGLATDIAYDRATGKLYLAFPFNDEVAFADVMSGRSYTIPASGRPDGVRIDAARGKLTIATSSSRAGLNVFTVDEATNRVTLAEHLGDAVLSFDAASAPDGSPRVVWTDNERCCTMAIFNGRVTVRTRVKAAFVAMDVDGRGRLAIAFHLMPWSSCRFDRWGTPFACRRNGFAFLQTDSRARRGRLSWIERHTGAGGGASVAAHGARVAIAIPAPYGKAGIHVFTRTLR